MRVLVTVASKHGSTAWSSRCGPRWSGCRSFSAHADAEGILGWLCAAPLRPRVCYVVHGESVALAALAARIDDELGWCAVLAHQPERVLL
ncbi:MAG TPA: MBL fold metallo-hydrolase RNA specificity domain-containing protein [Micromonosporaceae bacterium]|jgi:metallo-beta-lactamase family protein|nr:MBL fold metallo-hydrolase RNA specificity domain-containing protein [Micromonosporaceae bacterium]